MSTVQTSMQSQYQNILQVQSPTKLRSTFEPPSRFSNRIEQQLYKNRYTSAFFQDHVQEQYVIQRAFQCNNFTYLRKLPDNFRRGEILNQRKQKVARNNQMETFSRAIDYEEKLKQRQEKIKEKRKLQIGTLGYFDAFTYKQSKYTALEQLLSNQRKDNDKKRKQISEYDFRPSGVQEKMKYQDPFKYVEKISKLKKQQSEDSEKSQYLFPFHNKQDHYNIFKQDKQRLDAVARSLRINGDFIPSKKQSILTKPNRNLLSQIVNQLEIFLKKYLKHVGFFIGVTKQDHIQILFQPNKKEENKISLIMSKICENQMISKYILRRNLTKWGKLDSEKGYIIYCILPNWVKNPVEKLQSQIFD